MVCRIRDRNEPRPRLQYHTFRLGVGWILWTEGAQLTPTGYVFSEVVFSDHAHVAPSTVVVQSHFFFMLYKPRLVVLHGGDEVVREGLKCKS